MSGELETVLANTPERRPQASRMLFAIRAFAFIAVLISAYLTFVSISQHGLPLGCGSDSGCSEVLRSRWSFLFGLPMGAYALAVYLAVMGATIFVSPDRSAGVQSIGLTLLLAFTASIFLSVMWFVSLQLFVVKAICQWCMADHLAGLATAVAILCFWGKTSLATSASPEKRLKWGRPVLMGAVMALMLFSAQLFFSESGVKFGRLPGDRNTDTGPGPGRELAVLNGELPVAVDDVPILGSADADVPIVLLYDYCCPHCRATHGHLIERMTSYSRPYCIVLLPMPLDADCNESVEETETRFEESCELARIALAVWRADRSKFPQFDAWLYEPEMPRTAAEAQKHAADLIGANKLQSALNDPWIDERISQDVRAYNASGVEQIPLVLSPKMDAIVGRAENADDLFKVLESELNLFRAEN
ncbi:vitamin K epoxide reductase family protein [Symmachiella dynata]|uniref:vitamin K epoxide reductase family protein n=1 Tax=Symmachiella dynata TaxID=2527995 RepID=UPI0030EEBF4C